MRLRYTGDDPVTFMSRGEFAKGDEFDILDDDFEGWLRRTDIEIVRDPEPDPDTPPRSRKSAKAADDAASATTTAAE